MKLLSELLWGKAWEINVFHIHDKILHLLGSQHYKLDISLFLFVRRKVSLDTHCKISRHLDLHDVYYNTSYLCIISVRQ